MKKILSMILVGAFLAVNQTSALSCMYRDDMGHINSADVIFMGTVMSLSEKNEISAGTVYPPQVQRDRTNSYATLKVDGYWKGNLNSTVDVYGIYPWSGYVGNEKTFFNIGQKYIVYGHHTNGKISASIDCGRTSVYSQAGENLLTSSLGAYKIPGGDVNPPTTGNKCDYTNINKDLWYGNYANNRSEVFTLQNFLFRHYDILDETKPSGYYGKLTKFYVSQFQKDFGLRVTGGVGVQTRGKIKEICGQGNVDNGVPNTCKVWYDGCNTCSRSFPGGPLACTLMACLYDKNSNDSKNIWNSGAYCKEYFDSNSSSPTISSFNGPVTLAVGQKGTWSVAASTRDNQNLNYKITWGDEGLLSSPYALMKLSDEVVTQNTTFEHTYFQPGKYTVTIVVSTKGGQSSKTSATVTVISNK